MKFETFALGVGITADYRLGVRLRTSCMGVANLERSRTTTDEGREERTAKEPKTRQRHCSMCFECV